MLWTSLAGLLPLVYGGLLYNELPARVATHFGLNGQANEYSGKLTAILLLPLLLLAADWIVYLSTKYGKRTRKQSPKFSNVMLWMFPVMANVLQITMFVEALGYDAPIIEIVSMLMGMIFIVLGNYLLKLTPNSMMGVRIPSTMKNPENWAKTNRLAGVMFVLSGIGLLIAGLTGFVWTLAPMIGFTISFVLIAIVPLVYSLTLKNTSKD